MFSGVLKACQKRPVPREKLEDVVSHIELELYNDFDREVESRVVGDLVMKELKEIDPVAYVRFASVYRDFKDISEFDGVVKALIQEVERLKKLSAKGKRNGSSKA